MSISDGLGSRKLEVLADTAVTLEQSTEGAVVTEVIKKMLKVVPGIRMYLDTYMYVCEMTLRYSACVSVARCPGMMTNS